MKSVRIQAKTVEDAIAQALKQLNAEESEVEIKIHERESAGFFGIGGKDADVEVILLEEEVEIVDTVQQAEDSVDVYEDENDDDFDEDDTDEVDETEGVEDLEFEDRIQLAARAIDEFLNKVLDHFKLSGVNTVTVEVEENRIVADISGDDCGILIGRKGETLRSIQYIASLIANKTAKTRVRLVLDIGSYRAKRKDNVVGLATRTAERALRTGQAFELTPMSAADRRVVHESLNDYPGIVTYSEGEEPRRYVVIDIEFDEDFEEEQD